MAKTPAERAEVRYQIIFAKLRDPEALETLKATVEISEQVETIRLLNEALRDQDPTRFVTYATT